MGLKLEGHLGDTPIVKPVRLQANWGTFPIGPSATALVVGPIPESKRTTRSQEVHQKQPGEAELLGASPVKL